MWVVVCALPILVRVKPYSTLPLCEECKVSGGVCTPHFGESEALQYVAPVWRVWGVSGGVCTPHFGESEALQYHHYKACVKRCEWWCVHSPFWWEWSPTVPPLQGLCEEVWVVVCALPILVRVKPYSTLPLCEECKVSGGVCTPHFGESEALQCCPCVKSVRCEWWCVHSPFWWEWSPTVPPLQGLCEEVLCALPILVRVKSVWECEWWCVVVCALPILVRVKPYSTTTTRPVWRGVSGGVCTPHFGESEASTTSTRPVWRGVSGGVCTVRVKPYRPPLQGLCEEVWVVVCALPILVRVKPYSTTTTRPVWRGVSGGVCTPHFGESEALQYHHYKACVKRCEWWCVHSPFWWEWSPTVPPLQGLCEEVCVVVCALPILVRVKPYSTLPLSGECKVCVVVCDSLGLVRLGIAGVLAAALTALASRSQLGQELGLLPEAPLDVVAPRLNVVSPRTLHKGEAVAVCKQHKSVWRFGLAGNGLL